MPYQRVIVPSDETAGEDGLPEGAMSVPSVPSVPPIDQIRGLSGSDPRLVPRTTDTTNDLLDSIFALGLRASYKRRLILTLDDTPGFHKVMAALARADLSLDIANIMIEVLFGMVQLGVQKIDESIAREHAERARDSLRFDAITGLISQTAFNGYGPAVFDKLAEEGRLLAYIVADIDNFKTVNDSNGGHPAGDYVLAELGGIIRKQLRGDDIPVRNGGDEFVIVLPDTSPVEAIVLAERIRKAVESHEFIYEGRQFKVTLSIGVGTRQAEDTFETLHKRTDGLSYASKTGGKNRISVVVPEGMNVPTFPDSVNIVPAAGKPN